jgi:hypothetical protein
MNLRVIKFLLANQTVLLKIIEIGKGWRKDLPFIEQWLLVDSIARLLIPVLESQAVSVKALSGSRFDLLDDEEDYEALLFQAGAEFGILGVDWELLTTVILPLVIAILKALAAGKAV